MTELTDRTFTPPTTFPQEYVTCDGDIITIECRIPNSTALAGWGEYCCGERYYRVWHEWGDYDPGTYSEYDLHDLPEKEVWWINVNASYVSVIHHHSRGQADDCGTADRIGVIRMERVEGQMPNFFEEDV